MALIKKMLRASALPHMIPITTLAPCPIEIPPRCSVTVGARWEFVFECAA